MKALLSGVELFTITFLRVSAFIRQSGQLINQPRMNADERRYVKAE